MDDEHEGRMRASAHTMLLERRDEEQRLAMADADAGRAKATAVLAGLRTTPRVDVPAALTVELGFAFARIAALERQVENLKGNEK